MELAVVTDAALAALERLESGPAEVHASTGRSLASKGLVERSGDVWRITESGARFLTNRRRQIEDDRRWRACSSEQHALAKRAVAWMEAHRTCEGLGILRARPAIWGAILGESATVGEEGWAKAAGDALSAIAEYDAARARQEALGGRVWIDYGVSGERAVSRPEAAAEARRPDGTTDLSLYRSAR